MPDASLATIASPGTLDGGAGDGYRASAIHEIATQLKEDYQERDALCRQMDDLVFQQNKVSIPPAYARNGLALAIHSPMATYIATSLAAALSINGQTVSFTPGKEWQSELRNASLREKFFEASWKRQEREAKRRLLRLFVYSLVVKGEGILKTVQRTRRAYGSLRDYSDKWLAKLANSKQYRDLDYQSKDAIYSTKTEQFKRVAMPYPITTTDVPPEQVYRVLGEDGIAAVCETYEVPWLDALARFSRGDKQYGLSSGGSVVEQTPEAAGLPIAEWQAAMSGGKTLRCTELWTWKDCSYVLSGPGQKDRAGTVVRTYRHGYGDPITHTLKGPYFWAQGITTADRLPHRAAMGILFAFRDLFPLLDSLLTANANAAYMYGFPMFGRRMPNQSGLLGPNGQPLPFGAEGIEGEDVERAAEEWEPGKVLPYEVTPVQSPNASPLLQDIFARIHGFLEYAMPSVLRGDSAQSSSGWEFSQAAHLATLAYDPIVDNAEFALADRVGFESWLIDNKIGDEVYARGEMPVEGSRLRARPKSGWLCVGPDDLDDVHDYEVKLSPETPGNKVIDVRTHDAMVKAGFETRIQAIEELGGNADEVIFGTMYERLVLDDPAIFEKVKERALQKLGVNDQRALAGKANQTDLTQPQGPPNATAPVAGMGEMPIPGLAGQPTAPTPPGGLAAAAGMGGVPAGTGAARLPGPNPVVPNPPANALALPGG